MTGRHAVPDIGLQHGVVAHALDQDAVVGQHMRVVLQMLAELRQIGVFQQRLQCREHALAGQLLGRARIVMRQRHIRRLTGFNAEGDADDLGDHVIEAGGLRIEGEQRRAAQSCQPAFQLFPGHHGFVPARGGLRKRCRLGAVSGRCCAGTRRGGARSGAVGGATGQLAQQRTQFVARVQLLQARGIGRLWLQVIEAQRQIHIAIQRGQLARQRQGLKTAAQVLAHLALDIPGMFDDAVGAVVLRQPLGRGLRPHLRHAGNVVRRITHQRQVVDDLLGPHVELGLHAVPVQARVRHGIDDGDGGIDQLRHVLVAGRDDDLVAGRLGAPCQGADDIVGLDALDAQQRMPLCLENRQQRGDLGAQVVRHRRTVRLVGFKQIIAEGSSRRIEDDGQPGLRVVLGEFHHHVEHTQDRARGFPGCIGQRRHGVKGPVQVRGAVDQNEGGLGHS